jgi:hypothetical protein
MAESKRHKTGGQSLGTAIRQGSGKPCKSGGEESDRGKIWAGKERLLNEPDLLKNTSQSWIASIILVLNLVKLAGQALLCLSFSAWEKLKYLLYSVLEWLIRRIEKENPSGFNSGPVLEYCKT